jgi:hypothetical protein
MTGGVLVAPVARQESHSISQWSSLSAGRNDAGGPWGQSPTVRTDIEYLWMPTPSGIRRLAMVFGSSIAISGL